MELDGIFSWFSDVSGRVSFFVVPIKNSDTSIPWSDLSVAIVSALCSAAVAYLIYYLTRKYDLNKTKEDEKKKEAVMASIVHSKICRYHEIISKVREKVDVNYAIKDAERENKTEEGYVFHPIYVNIINPEPIGSHEFSFLFTRENYHIVEKIKKLEADAFDLVGYLSSMRDLQNFYKQMKMNAPPSNFGDRNSTINNMFNRMSFSKKRLDINKDLEFILNEIIRITYSNYQQSTEAVECFTQAATRAEFSKYFQM